MALSKITFKPGIVKDDAPLAAEGGFVDADKVRFRQGQAQTVGGWERASSSAFTGLCRGLHTWANLDGAPVVGIGTHSALWVFYGGGLYDITPVGLAAGLADGTGGSGYGTGTYGSGTYGSPSVGAYYPRTWSLSNWGEYLLGVPRGGTLYEWTGATGTPAAEIVNAPDAITCMWVTAERIVMCGGATEFGGVTFNPMLLRWSDQEDNTNWTPAATNQAGDLVLSQGGRIVKGLASRKTNLVWTDTALYSLTYLGDPLLVYGAELLGQGCGLIGPNAAVELNGAAYWLGSSGEFFTFSGGQAQPIPCPVKRYVADNLSWVQADKIYAGSNSANNEVWWFYPDSRDGNECSRYVIYNYAENHWSIGTWDRTAWADAGVWQHPLATDASGYLYFHERLNSADGGAITAYLESAPSDIGDGDTLMAVTRIVPDFEDLSGGLTVTLKGRLWPAGDETEHGPYTVLTTTERVDLRTTARQMAIRIDSASAPSFWRLGALRLDMVQSGAKR
jgi:hypothetical protein